MSQTSHWGIKCLKHIDLSAFKLKADGSPQFTFVRDVLTNEERSFFVTINSFHLVMGILPLWFKKSLSITQPVECLPFYFNLSNKVIIGVYKDLSVNISFSLDSIGQCSYLTGRKPVVSLPGAQRYWDSSCTHSHTYSWQAMVQTCYH